jgi:hypothetical protein
VKVSLVGAVKAFAAESAFKSVIAVH